MSKQWMAVLFVLGGLAAGSLALVRMGEKIQRVEVGSTMPDFRLADAHTGDSLGLRERYRGSVTLVNIWATWCTPCRIEMPSMQRAFDSLRNRGFRIAAVSIDEDDPARVTEWTTEMGLTFDILHDRTGAIQRVYQTTGVPESFLVDREGVIVRRVIGAHDWSSPVNLLLIERLLEDADPSAGAAAGREPEGPAGG